MCNPPVNQWHVYFQAMKKKIGLNLWLVFPNMLTEWMIFFPVYEAVGTIDLFILLEIIFHSISLK